MADLCAVGLKRTVVVRVSCLYILEIKPLLSASFANIFSHSFHFVYGFLCCAKACKFD